MEKIASSATLTAPQLQNIAQLGFATALASPMIGCGPEVTKIASTAFKAALTKNAERHERFKGVILEFAK